MRLGLVIAAMIVGPAANAGAQANGVPRLVLETHYGEKQALAQDLGISRAAHLMTREGLRFKKRTWWAHSLKKIDLEYRDPFFDMRIKFSTKMRGAVLDFDPSLLHHLRVRMHTKVRFSKGRASIKARFRVFNDYLVELPEVHVVPRTWRGQTYVEYQLPILSGKF